MRADVVNTPFGIWIGKLTQFSINSNGRYNTNLLARKALINVRITLESDETVKKEDALLSEFQYRNPAKIAGLFMLLKNR